MLLFSVHKAIGPGSTSVIAREHNARTSVENPAGANGPGCTFFLREVGSEEGRTLGFGGAGAGRGIRGRDSFLGRWSATGSARTPNRGPREELSEVLKCPNAISLFAAFSHVLCHFVFTELQGKFYSVLHIQTLSQKLGVVHKNQIANCVFQDLKPTHVTPSLSVITILYLLWQI